MKMKSCTVCCDVFTQKIRHEIVCIHCKGSFCQKCFCTYLLSEDTKQVCMLCFEEINTEFIYLHTPKVFRDKYFTKETENILREEMVLLNATKEKIHLEKRSKLLSSRIMLLVSHLNKYPSDVESSTFLDKSREELKECRKVLNLADTDISRTSRTVVCSVVACDGLTIRGVCNVCKTRTCCECNSIVNGDIDEHTCDPDILETIKLLKRDTKPCPKCSVPIHKIEGCDQMFCVSCHTAFSWRTGKIESGTIHNPHYFQWLRERGNEIPRNPGDDPCGQVLETAIRSITKGKTFKGRNAYCKDIVDRCFIEKVLRELNVVITRISTVIHDVDEIDDKKRKLRVKYIQSQEDENMKKRNWFVAIKTLLRKHEMNKDCLGLLQTFERGLKDSLIDAYTNNDFDELEQTIQSLDNYFSEQVHEIKKRHGLTPHMKIVVPNGLNTKWLN